MNRNEQLYGPSLECLEVLQNFELEHVNQYADGYFNSLLRKRLSDKFNFPENQIILGNGGEDLLKILFEKLSEDDSVLIPNPSYTFYKKYLDTRGNSVHSFDFQIVNGEYSYATDLILSEYKKYSPKLILLASPNNPTGNTLTVAELEEILKNIESKTIVVLDEAYWGFDNEYNQVGFVSLVSKYPNLMLLRSFSKLYGLAGLRIGFGICGILVLEYLNWQHQYLGFSRILEEVAVAALNSEDYYKNIAETISKDRDMLISELSGSKYFTPYRSKSNFVLVSFDAKYQKQVEETLSDEDAVIAKIIDSGMMRVTIGTTEHVQKFINLLKTANYEY
ncbi:MAG: aminotransferase class I/II-fold pyridoxal phosphate-dependent enzyme [Candidatus Pacebacteria bacterium]|nr:aminotransferase class I/II-fold pyridoxal phosphate-dependent enzyme [Candidatus Paceibacterota bacterium]